MDLILEGLDTYVLDKVYAQLLPVNGHGAIVDALRSAPTWNAMTGSAKTILSPGKNSTLNYGTYVNPLMSQLFKQNTRDIYGVPGRPTALGLPITEYTHGSILERDSLIRLTVTLFFVTWIFGYLLYFITAALQYWFVYDPINFSHPRYLKNQVRMELKQSFISIPIMSAMTVPWFILELRGYSKLYMNVEDHGWLYFGLQFPIFLMFTDCGIYLIHRFLHHPVVYKHLHKPHHKWIIPTPFASHAFHPVDGYMQSLPYHLFPFVFPLQKVAYMVLFTLVNIWSVMIHDGKYLSNNPVVNGSACHTIHHLYFNYNYGQYTTLWDRIGGSYRVPDQELFDKNMNMAKNYLEKQVSEMTNIMEGVEGKDEREYIGDKTK